MNEVNFNVNRSSAMDKPLSSTAETKNSARTNSTGADSVQFSHFPDISQAENSVEQEFADLRTRFQGAADSSAYPPGDIIDRLARMLAIEGPKH